MSFTVFFATSPDAIDFGDRANYKIMEGGALQVTDGNDTKIWSPTAWLRLEQVRSNRPVHVAPGVRM